MLNYVIEITGYLFPLIITFLAPIVIILFIVWIILKLSKVTIGIVEKILKWTFLILIIVLAFWVIINVLGGYGSV